MIWKTGEDPSSQTLRVLAALGGVVFIVGLGLIAMGSIDRRVRNRFNCEIVDELFRIGLLRERIDTDNWTPQEWSHDANRWHEPKDQSKWLTQASHLTNRIGWCLLVADLWVVYQLFW